MGAGHPEGPAAVSKSTPQQVPLEASVAVVFCAAAGIPLRRLWSEDKSMLEEIHLEASVAVDKSMPQQVDPQTDYAS